MSVERFLIEVVNLSGSPIPAYGVVEVYGQDQHSRALAVRRPTKSSLPPARLLFAGPAIIPKNGRGICHATFPAVALYKGTATLGAGLGSVEGSFRLAVGEGGFLAIEEPGVETETLVVSPGVAVGGGDGTNWKLRVEEDDGSPSVTPVDVIQFDADDFEVTDIGANTAKVALRASGSGSGGGGSGGSCEGEIARWEEAYSVREGDDLVQYRREWVLAYDGQGCVSPAVSEWSSEIVSCLPDCGDPGSGSGGGPGGEWLCDGCSYPDQMLYYSAGPGDCEISILLTVTEGSVSGTPTWESEHLIDPDDPDPEHYYVIRAECAGNGLISIAKTIYDGEGDIVAQGFTSYEHGPNYTDCTEAYFFNGLVQEFFTSAGTAFAPYCAGATVWGVFPLE